VSVGECLDEFVAVVALHFDVAFCGNGAASAEGGFELLEQRLFVGVAHGEAGDDGDEFACAFFAADADGGLLGVDNFAVFVARAGASAQRLLAKVAGGGEFEGGAGEEAGHEEVAEWGSDGVTKLG